MEAVLERYISIGKIRNEVLRKPFGWINDLKALFYGEKGQFYAIFFFLKKRY